MSGAWKCSTNVISAPAALPSLGLPSTQDTMEQRHCSGSEREDPGCVPIPLALYCDRELDLHTKRLHIIRPAALSPSRETHSHLVCHLSVGDRRTDGSELWQQQSGQLLLKGRRDYRNGHLLKDVHEWAQRSPTTVQGRKSSAVLEAVLWGREFSILNPGFIPLALFIH